MASRAKEDTIVVDVCLRATQKAIGNRLTDLFGFPYDFAVNTADLAKRLYQSRQDPDYILSYSVDERDHCAETLWAATLLSQASNFGDMTYDRISELTNPEVADYLQYVQPMKTIPIFQGAVRLMTELGQCNSRRNYGPILSVMSYGVTAVECLAQDVDKLEQKLQSSTNAAQVWSINYIINQLDRASLGKWSAYALDTLGAAQNKINRWTRLRGFPTVTSRYQVSWTLDTTTQIRGTANRYIEIP